MLLIIAGVEIFDYSEVYEGSRKKVPPLVVRPLRP